MKIDENSRTIVEMSLGLIIIITLENAFRRRRRRLQLHGIHGRVGALLREAVFYRFLPIFRTFLGDFAPDGLDSRSL